MSLLTDWQQNSLRYKSKGQEVKFLPLKFILLCGTMTTVKERNGIIQEKYLTVSVVKKDIEEARTYFARIASDLRAHFSALGSKCEELDATEKLRLLHDFYRAGEEASFRFDLADMMKKGHDFKDYICPDSMERADDYVKLGEKYVRVLFLKDYASYIKDSMVCLLRFMVRRSVRLY